MLQRVLLIVLSCAILVNCGSDSPAEPEGSEFHIQRVIHFQGTVVSGLEQTPVAAAQIALEDWTQFCLGTCPPRTPDTVAVAFTGSNGAYSLDHMMTAINNGVENCLGDWRISVQPEGYLRESKGIWLCTDEVHVYDFLLQPDN